MALSSSARSVKSLDCSKTAPWVVFFSLTSWVVLTNDRAICDEEFLLVSRPPLVVGEVR